MVYENSNMKDVICEMTSKKLGITAIVDSNRRLTGIITDGDLRRLLEREIGMKIDIFNLKASEVMTKNPKIISPDALAVSAVQMMESYSITSLIIKNDDDTVGGIIHLHDLLKKGIV